MKPTRLIILLAAALGLSACMSVDTATRNATVVPAPQSVGAAAPYFQTRSSDAIEAVAIRDISVRVPRSLVVSEANSYKPRADIVWREDPLGDRYVQVETLLREGLDPLRDLSEGGHGIVVDLQITRFHALTEKTRYTVGGKHEIMFFLTLIDAETGQILAKPRLIETNFEAYGGARALEAMSRGETQKVRIQRHMRELLRAEVPAFIAPPAPKPAYFSDLGPVLN